MAKSKAQKRLEAAQRQQQYDAKFAGDSSVLVAPSGADEVRETMIDINVAAGELRTPRLIQRAMIKRPVSKFAGKPLGDAITLDYMGNSEFEFGAVSRSLRVLQAFAGQIGIYDHPTIRHSNGKRLTVMRFLNDEKAAQYDDYLSRMRGEGAWLHTAEYTQFDKRDDNCEFSKADLWWDIGNHVIWSFDNEFMTNLRFCLEATWAKMDHERRTRRHNLS